ncbi:conserved protein of unknown function (plasmid) [Paraburkholderia kururiensis]|uniref:hypothetical protein n=1 Tax=Paraburkholderia kururiensis TaxID=984307 RepID=UPI0039A63C07
MTSLSFALDARTQWALYRVSVVAGNERDAESRLFRALQCARGSGDAPDAEPQCPALLADVQPLRIAYMEAFEAVRQRLERRRTRDGIDAELREMARDASHGCGLSYELFVKRFSQDVDDFLDVLEEPFRPLALEIATGRGYATQEEREAMQDEIEESGGCSLTGIDPWCCPCGNHE